MDADAKVRFFSREGSEIAMGAAATAHAGEMTQMTPGAGGMGGAGVPEFARIESLMQVQGALTPSHSFWLLWGQQFAPVFKWPSKKDRAIQQIAIEYSKVLLSETTSETALAGTIARLSFKDFALSQLTEEKI